MKIRACSECKAENDTTRVYCANCGVRLPEEAVETASPEASGGSAPALPPAKKMRGKKPRRESVPRGFWQLIAGRLFGSAIVAALLAALIQIAREPDGIPAPAGEDPALSADMAQALRKHSRSEEKSQWLGNQKALNTYLETTVKMEPKNTAGPGMQAEFQRAFVRLGQGQFDFGIEQKFLGRAIYFIIGVVPEPGPGGLRANVAGGSLGRLPVHPVLMPYFLRAFGPTFLSLAYPIDCLKAAESVTITPDDVTIQWPGTASAAR